MDDDVSANAKSFRSSLPDTIVKNISAVTDKNSAKLDDAYARLTCLQAIRSCLLDNNISEGALGFFNEAQGDGLTSLVLTMSGSSRSALKSLRSLIENIIRSTYYADHVIEYRLWEDGKHRPTFRSFFQYLDEHPDLSNLPPNLNPAPRLELIWKKLSNAVHASAKKERMSGEDSTIIVWKTSPEFVGQCLSYQRDIIRDVVLLYMSIYKLRLQGAMNSNCRQSLAFSIPKSYDKSILKVLEIVLPRK